MWWSKDCDKPRELRSGKAVETQDVAQKSEESKLQMGKGKGRKHRTDHIAKEKRRKGDIGKGVKMLKMANWTNRLFWGSGLYVHIVATQAFCKAAAASTMEQSNIKGCVCAWLAFISLLGASPSFLNRSRGHLHFWISCSWTLDGLHGPIARLKCKFLPLLHSSKWKM